MEERLVEEVIELTKKITKLEVFMEKEEFEKLENDKKCLLKEQRECMQGYQSCLMLRIVTLMKE